MRSTLVATTGLALSLLTATTVAADRVGYLVLEGEFPERHAVAPFFLGTEQQPTLREFIETIDEIAASGDLNGLVLRLQEPQLAQSQIEEIGAALTRLRGSGVKVHIFSEIYDQSNLLLASYADNIIAQDGGYIMLTGIYMEEMFLADTLRWAGVEPDFVQIGDYKGAKEMFANSQPSPEWDANINQLLDGMYGLFTGRIKTGRGMTDQQLENAMTDGLFLDPADARQYGLIDQVADRLDLDARLEGIHGDDFQWDTEYAPGESGPDFSSMGLFEAFAEIMKMLENPGGEPTRDTIAVVHIDGPIMDGDSSGGGFMGGASVGSRTIREALAKIENDDHIKGVIVRINSPGGSASASEIMWQGLRRLAPKKPVWASVGTMAASGGYYVAMGTDKIYVNNTSIVGSIGVVGGKLAMDGLYDKLHMNVVPRARGPMAGVLGSLKPWSEAERRAVTGSMTRVYEQFVERVKGSRKGIDISKTAEGRLFVGQKAIGLEMADEVGGLSSAIDDMASKLGLAEGAYDIIDYPAPKSLEDLFSDGFPFAGAAVQHSAAAAMRELLGPVAWRSVQAALTAALQLRSEPVLLVTPSILIFK